MTVTTDAEITYDFICESVPIGDSFTAWSLHDAMKNHGLSVTYSALTSFLTRALRREMIIVVGYGDRKARIYQLASKPTWEFGPKTIGSLPGRTIHKESVIHDLRDGSDEVKKGLQDWIGNSDTAVVEGSTVPTPFSIPVSAIKENRIVENRATLSDLLINIAADVERLELKPEKQLSDFTTDELMTELKRRVR